MALPSTYPRERTRTFVTGVVVGITPSTAGFTVELQRVPELAGVPDTGNAVTIAHRTNAPVTGFRYLDALPINNTPYYYRFRLTLEGYTAGAWSAIAGPAKATVIEEELARSATGDPSIYPIRRDYFAVDGLYFATAVDDEGLILDGDVVQTDGVASRRLVGGRQTGVARHTDAVTFNPVFQNAPVVLLTGGISYEPRSGQWVSTYSTTLPQYQEREALDVDASGFDVRARLKQKGTPTSQSDNFTASNNLDTDGESVEANLDPAAAASDSYTIHYSVQLRVKCPVAGSQSGGVTVAIDSNDGAGWVERLATPYSASAVAGSGGCAFQYGRPDGTIDGWTTGSYLSIDEVSPSDGDFAELFIDYGTSVFTDYAENSLSNVTDPAISTGHKVRIRHKWTGTQFNGSAYVYLKQGATTKATFLLGNSPGTFTTETFELSGAEADSITDYTDLRLAVELIADLDDSATLAVSWMEFAIESASYQETNWTHEQKTIVVSGLGLNDDVRVRIKSVQDAANLYSFSVHAFDGTGDPASGVTYTTTSGDHYASMTPDTEDKVTWEAFAV